jgi:hypothetical protein
MQMCNGDQDAESIFGTIGALQCYTADLKSFMSMIDIPHSMVDPPRAEPIPLIKLFSGPQINILWHEL